MGLGHLREDGVRAGTASNDMEICLPGSLILGAQQPLGPSIRLEVYTFLIPTSSRMSFQGLSFLVEPFQGTTQMATRL